MPTSDRLDRVLSTILPMGARKGGVTFEELERALCVDRATIVADIQDAMGCAYNHPGGSVDAFELSFDDECVRVHTTREFQRPTRLNAREALAVALGLRLLASEADVERRAQILALAERLERELAAPIVERQPRIMRELASVVREDEPAYGVAVGEDDLRSLFAEAIEQRRVCAIEYMKPHAAPVLREVLPQLLIYGNGHWYVAGIDVALNEQRNFRLDRIISADMTRRTMPEAEAVEQLSFYSAAEQDEVEARVRYSPRVARWIAEQNGGVLEPDGSMVVTHRVADVDWLVRHVLQYGGEAVVETPELRDVVANAAAALCA